MANNPRDNNQMPNDRSDQANVNDPNRQRDNDGQRRQQEAQQGQDKTNKQQGGQGGQGGMNDKNDQKKPQQQR